MSTTLLHGDCRAILPTLPERSVQCVVTSPPYFGLRDYGVGGQIGLEPTPAEYVAALVAVFREVRRVLRNDGVLWLNLGTSYAGSSMTSGTSSKEGSAKRAGRMFEKGSQVGAAVMADAHEPFTLRDDLTPDELAYVLRELAASISQGDDEVAIPQVRR